MVEIAAVQLREPHRRELTGDDRRQRAQPLRHARHEPHRSRPEAEHAPWSEITITLAPSLDQAVDRRLHALERGPRRCDRDHRPAGTDRRDRAVHQVGGGIRLEEQPGELADLQRDLERGAVVDPAGDDGATR